MSREEKIKLLLEIQDHHLTSIKRKIAHEVGRVVDARCVIEGGNDEEVLFHDCLEDVKVSLREILQIINGTITILEEGGRQ